MLIRCVLLAVCASALVCGQGQYVFNDAFSLAGAGTAWTIQQPASGGLRLNFKYVTISSSAALSITFERQCTTPATATTAPITRKNPEATSINAKATAWRASNASGCTVMYGPIFIPSGAGVTLTLDGDYLNGSGVEKGLTIRAASATANGSINWHFEEIK